VWYFLKRDAMGMPPFLRDLRRRIGHDLLLLPAVNVRVLDDRGRLLLAHHRDRGLWVLPGGIIEPSESPADAAVRETWEETGYVVELTGLFGLFGGPNTVATYSNGDRAAYVSSVFRARTIGGALRAGADEISEVRFVSADEFIVLPHAPWLDAIIGPLFDETGSPAQFQPSTWRPPVGSPR
jgi:8-oxo-dGTP pyrophosphatase MutT (NUDIX family)